MAVQPIIHKSIDWFRSRILQRPAQHTALLGSPEAPMRLLVVANALIPTVQLSLVYPLEASINIGQCAIDFLTEHDMKQKFGKKLRSVEVAAWVKSQIITKKPTHIVFCRYSGPHYEEILAVAESQCIPTIYFIDDDLLNVPLELGQQKYDYHNHPLRLSAIRHLLSNVDLVHCSNERLKSHLQALGIGGNLQTGKIFCAGKVISPAEERQAALIGYMGFDHAHDFEVALPALIKILRKYPELQFEIFGKIPKPAILNEFGKRIVVLPVVSNYDEFLKVFASRKWDVGICPLAPTEFNKVKNINKWIEYTAVGAAVIASAGTIYDTCCSDDCGLLASTQDEWLTSIETLITESNLRFQLVSNAQKRLEQEYSVNKLRDQVLNIFQQAREDLKHDMTS